MAMVVVVVVVVVINALRDVLTLRPHTQPPPPRALPPPSSYQGGDLFDDSFEGSLSQILGNNSLSLSIDLNNMNVMNLDQSCKVSQPGPRVGLDPQPATLDPRPSTLDPRPSTLNPRPSTLNPRPSTLNPQPSTLNSQPAAVSIGHPRDAQLSYIDRGHRAVAQR